jgi:hypothetical protein
VVELGLKPEAVQGTQGVTMVAVVLAALFLPVVLVVQVLAV